METITTAALKAMRDQGDDFTLINTLPEESFDKTSIPGAINIPQNSNDFVDRVEHEIGGKDKPVVVYCASTQCDSSTKGAQKLEDAGFTNVMDYEAGAKGWQEDADKSVAAEK